MNDEQQDPLWDLLGKAREPKPSPFFARKVLRAIREEEEKATGLFSWLRRQWLIPLGCTAMAALALFFTLQSTQPVPASDPVDEMAEVVADNVDTEDSQVIADLAELIAYEDTSIWLEPDSTFDY